MGSGDRGEGDSWGGGRGCQPKKTAQNILEDFSANNILKASESFKFSFYFPA